mmetsp:Transcript_26658/g.58401  ORF Transcript_26658/g.58401 Transcript_26658/m.58401 type:complete len:82 (+) Transcript_26658:171-416(+)
MPRCDISISCLCATSTCIDIAVVASSVQCAWRQFLPTSRSKSPSPPPSSSSYSYSSRCDRAAPLIKEQSLPERISSKRRRR